jgi:hypothetical protein
MERSEATLVECDDCWTCNFMFSSGENAKEDAGP